MGPTYRFRGDGAGDEDVDEWRGDAVVQPALDVEDPTNVRGDVLVLHDRGTERGVGRRDDGADGGSHPKTGAVEEQRHDGEPAAMVRGRPDAEQAEGDGRIDAEGAHVDPGGVHEEHQRQGDLGQRPDRRRVQAEVHEARRTVGHEDSEDDDAIGAETSQRSSRAETRAHRRTQAAMTASATRPKSWFMGSGALRVAG